MSFYVVLPSNVSENISNFNTTLSQRLNLSQDWTVGLTEISYTKSWFNVAKDSNVKLLFSDGVAVSDKHPVIKAGFYDTPEILCDAINNILKQIEMGDYPSVSYNKFNNKITLKAGHMQNEYVFPSFDFELEEMMGIYGYQENRYDVVNDQSNYEIIINDLEKFKNGVHEAKFPIEISAGYHSLYVYTDIVYPTIVGNSFVPLLRQVEVPHKAQFGEQCVIKYDNPQYHSLISTEIDKINIRIEDDTGKPIPFNFGRCIVTLHFKKL